MKYFFVLMFLANSILAQNRQKGSYTVYLNSSTYSIKADVVYENKKNTSKEELTYFWYASNKIMETRGGYDGRLLDGLYICFYLSDNLKEKGKFENGLRDGVWQYWYENGKIKETTTWKNGEKNGIYKKYDIHGNLLVEATNKKGKLNGYEIKYEGEKIIRKIKYEDGIEILPKVEAPSKEKTPFATKIKKLLIKKDKTTDNEIAKNKK